MPFADNAANDCGYRRVFFSFLSELSLRLLRAVNLNTLIVQANLQFIQ